MSTHEPKLLLRLMAQAASAAEAEDEMRQAARRIAPHAAVARRTAEPYWKIPEWWEITLHLQPAGPVLAAFDGVRSLAKARWTLGEWDETDEHRWAVWNPAPGVEFLTPKVRWAELQAWNLKAAGPE